MSERKETTRKNVSQKTKFLPTLYTIAKNGKRRSWRVWAETNVVHKEYGLVDGKKIHNTREHKGKNKGRKNETTDEEQAILIAQREWTKQLDKDYKVDSDDIKGMKIYNKVMKEKESSGGANHTASKKVGKSGSGSGSKTGGGKKKTNLFVGKNCTFETVNISILPMKCKPYNPKKTPKQNNITLDAGVFVQTKLDGVRCAARYQSKGENDTNSGMVLTSNTNKQFVFLSSLRKDIRVFWDCLWKVSKDYISIDGECYSHVIYDENGDEIPEEDRFRTITGAARVVRKAPHPSEEQIDYYIFDLIPTGKEGEKSGEGKPQYIRLKDLRKAYDLYLEHESCKNRVVLTETRFIKDEDNDPEELYQINGEFFEKNFEGIIIRDQLNFYVQKHRSSTIRKYKLFVDAEFKIVGAKEGEGNCAGQVIWICETESGEKFSSRPRGSAENRAWYWEHHDEYIGKYLTVRYQKNSNDSDEVIPRFNVGIAIRDYE